jgi:hypothetical protein
MFSLSLFAIWLASSSSTSTTPGLPGGILAWIICYRARRSPIGGWLLFFYWQLYGGLLMAVIFFSMNLQSYVFENFDDSRKFYMYLASVGPYIILYLAQIVVGTLLLTVRTWDLLQLLRWLTAGQVAAALVSIVIDSNYYPDNVALNFLTLIPQSLWLAYMFMSARIKHVFKLHDWDIAVKVIYPEQPKALT